MNIKKYLYKTVLGAGTATGIGIPTGLAIKFVDERDDARSKIKGIEERTGRIEIGEKKGLPASDKDVKFGELIKLRSENAKLKKENDELKRLQKPGDETDYTSLAMFLCKATKLQIDSGWTKSYNGYGYRPSFYVEGKTQAMYISIVVEDQTTKGLKLYDFSDGKYLRATVEGHREWAESYLKTKGKTC